MNRPKKRLRRNYYKNSPAKARASKLHTVKTVLGITGGVVLVLAFSLGLILGYEVLIQCEYFKARQVEIHGNRMLSAEEVVRQSGFDPGGNILDANLGAIRSRLMAHPWIRDAEVRRELPDRIFMTIIENRPLAILDLGRNFLVDETGLIFKEVEDGDPKDLPTITGLCFSDIRIGDQRGSACYKAVMDVLSLGREAGCVLPNEQIREVAVDKEIGLTIYGREDMGVIELGYDNYLTKYARLRDITIFLRQTQPEARVALVDLKNINRVVIRPEGSQMGA